MNNLDVSKHIKFGVLSNKCKELSKWFIRVLNIAATYFCINFITAFVSLNVLDSFMMTYCNGMRVAMGRMKTQNSVFYYYFWWGHFLVNFKVARDRQIYFWFVLNYLLSRWQRWLLISKAFESSTLSKFVLSFSLVGMVDVFYVIFQVFDT